MSSVTVRIDDQSRETLRELSGLSGQSMQEVLHQAVEAYRRRVFLEQVNAAYGKLKADPKAWAELQRERDEWDATLGDGLDRRRPRLKRRK